MEINNKDLSTSDEDRNKFTKYYDAAVNDILILKYECNLSTKEISNTTPYQIDFINYIINMYQLNKINNEYVKYIKITPFNIDIDKMKKEGHNDYFINEMINPEVEGTEYFEPL